MGRPIERNNGLRIDTFRVLLQLLLTNIEIIALSDQNTCCIEFCPMNYFKAGTSLAFCNLKREEADLNFKERFSNAAATRTL